MWFCRTEERTDVWIDRHTTGLRELDWDEGNSDKRVGGGVAELPSSNVPMTRKIKSRSRSRSSITITCLCTLKFIIKSCLTPGHQKVSFKIFHKWLALINIQWLVNIHSQPIKVQRGFNSWRWTIVNYIMLEQYWNLEATFSFPTHLVILLFYCVFTIHQIRYITKGALHLI